MHIEALLQLIARRLEPVADAGVGIGPIAPTLPPVNGAGPISASLFAAFTGCSANSTGSLAVVLNDTRPTLLRAIRSAQAV